MKSKIKKKVKKTKKELFQRDSDLVKMKPK